MSSVTKMSNVSSSVTKINVEGGQIPSPKKPFRLVPKNKPSQKEEMVVVERPFNSVEKTKDWIETNVLDNVSEASSTGDDISKMIDDIVNNSGKGVAEDVVVEVPKPSVINVKKKQNKIKVSLNCRKLRQFEIVLNSKVSKARTLCVYEHLQENPDVLQELASTYSADRKNGKIDFANADFRIDMYGKLVLEYLAKTVNDNTCMPVFKSSKVGYGPRYSSTIDTLEFQGLPSSVRNTLMYNDDNIGEYTDPYMGFHVLNKLCEVNRIAWPSLKNFVEDPTLIVKLASQSDVSEIEVISNFSKILDGTFDAKVSTKSKQLDLELSTFKEQSVSAFSELEKCPFGIYIKENVLDFENKKITRKDLQYLHIKTMCENIQARIIDTWINVIEDENSAMDIGIEVCDIVSNGIVISGCNSVSVDFLENLIKVSSENIGVKTGHLIKTVKAVGFLDIPNDVLENAKTRIDDGFCLEILKAPILELDTDKSNIEEEELYRKVVAEFEEKWTFVADTLTFYISIETPSFRTCVDTFELIEGVQKSIKIFSLCDAKSTLASTHLGVFNGGFNRLNFKRWINSFTKSNEVSTVVMRPDLPPGRCKGVFNIFEGFNYSKEDVKDRDIATDTDSLDDFFKLGRKLVSGDGDVECNFTYLMCSIACLVQRPAIKFSVIIILHGLFGCGKDMFLDALFNAILGSKSYFVSKSPGEDFINTQYNGCIASALVVKGEEMSFTDTKNSLEKFKSMVTVDKMTIQEKHEKLRVVDSFHRFFFTTNNTVPMALDTGDRRTVIFSDKGDAKADEKVNWKALKSKFETDEFKKAICNFFYNFKIPNTFDAKLSRPETSMYKEVIVACRPPLADLFERLICGEFSSHHLKTITHGKYEKDENENGVKISFTGTELFNFIYNESRVGSNIKDKLTQTKLGRDLKMYPPIVKRHSKVGAVYEINLVELETYMKSKNWWCGFQRE